MTYKAMRREAGSQRKTAEAYELFVDRCLKEGTDQGWTLHSFEQPTLERSYDNWFTFIWETND